MAGQEKHTVLRSPVNPVRDDIARLPQADLWQAVVNINGIERRQHKAKEHKPQVTRQKSKGKKGQKQVVQHFCLRPAFQFTILDLILTIVIDPS